MKRFLLFPLLLSVMVLFTFGLFAQPVNEMWGMTQNTIFKTDATGDNMTVVHKFEDSIKGSYPQNVKLAIGAGGKMYGTCSGIPYLYVFDLNTNVYDTLFSFDDPTDGQNPDFGVMLASDGLLYGVARTGGVNDLGVLFSYDTLSNNYTKIFDFDGANGEQPKCVLYEATNGKLYGSTNLGGVNNQGVLFTYEIATGTFQKIHDFDGPNGGRPVGEFVEESPNNLYFVTEFGGTNNHGSICSVNTATDAVSLHVSFTDVIEGKFPRGLMKASNGLMYGVCGSGGSSYDGTLFSFNPTGNVLVNEYNMFNNGLNSNVTLLEENGTLIWSHIQGGLANGGTIYAFDISTSNLAALYGFDNLSGDPIRPKGSFVKHPNGLLYSTCLQGGVNNAGSIYSFDLSNNSVDHVIEFAYAPNGRTANYSFVEAFNGDLYGVTSTGGEYNNGVMFRIDPITGQYTKMYDFNTSFGTRPSGSLMLASDNVLYGVAFSGGAHGYGTIYSYSPSTGYSVIHNFEGYTSTINNEGNPMGRLVEVNGKLYGIAMIGGSVSWANYGVLFEYDLSTYTYTRLADLNDGSGGGYGGSWGPYGNFLVEDNGFLYGFAAEYNVLFKYEIATNLLSDASVTAGDNSSGGMLKHSNGKLYGFEGVYTNGHLISYDPVSDIYNLEHDFNTSDGTYPYGTPTEGFDSGKLYGMTTRGGASDLGTLFEFDVNTQAFTVKYEFSGDDGLYPRYTQLLKTSFCYPSASNLTEQVCESYTSPSGLYEFTAAGTYYDAIPSACGGDSIITIDLTILGLPTNTVTQTDVTLTADQAGAQYQWLDCDDNNAIINGETAQSYTSGVTGNYAVEVTLNGCADTSACFLVDYSGLSDLNSELIQIYPNPTNDGVLFINYDGQINAIEIMDMTGRKVSSSVAIENNTIDASELSMGNYLIHISTNEGVVVKEVTIVR